MSEERTEIAMDSCRYCGKPVRTSTAALIGGSIGERHYVHKRCHQPYLNHWRRLRKALTTREHPMSNEINVTITREEAQDE